MHATDRATTVEAELAYTRAADVGPDAERPGLLRARTRPPEAGRSLESFDLRTCRLRDVSAGDPSGLVQQGFDCVDLSGVDGLRPLLERVRDAGHVRDEDARAIRRSLAGQRLALGDGSRLRLLAIAGEGFIMRKAGPNGMPVSAPGAMSPMNDHDAALAVHADQDVRGTPLRQLMRGAAPWLFHHDAPDSRNGWSPVWLLNLWIPLQEVTRPLALMDKRTLDRRAHQLRYGLPTDAFLDRDEDRRINDIWTFLHDESQQWCFRSEMPLGRAWVFETLGTPHGSFVLPSEALAERRYRQLAAACEAIGRGDEPGLRSAVASDGERPDALAPAPLRRAIEAMDQALDDARAGAAALVRGGEGERWLARAQRAMDAVVRKSIEMRVVALRTPRPWRRRRPAPAREAAAS